MADEFLTVAEVADLLKLNQQTVRNWITADTLPHVRVGRRVLIRHQDIDTLLGHTGSNGPGEDLLTVAEVAELLKLSQQTIRNWIDAGTLTAIRIGRRVRIGRADAEKTLKAGETVPHGDELSAEDFWSGKRPVGNAVLNA
jgi:excisionase family DNA binding protein